jgi:Cu2+-exporting ATPase
VAGDNLIGATINKTGIITKGEPEVTDVFWHPEVKDQQYLAKIILSMEARSEHPLATAVVKYFEKYNRASILLQNFDSITGKGIIATYKGRPILSVT